MFARLAAAIEFSGEAIISSTLDGTITSWNPAAERMFGYFSEEVIGKSETVLIPQDRAGEISDLMATIRAGRQVENFETLRVRKDGSVFPISLTSTPIRDSDGTIIGASSTPHDITNQKEASEAAMHMAAIVEYSGEAIISQTLDGAVTTWNPAAEAMFGYASQEIIGKPIELLSPKGRTGELISILMRIKAGRTVEHHETVRIRKDGTEIRVSLTVSPVRAADGAIIGLSSIARDLTKQE
jgi:PAS domain S-box-containing protein